MKTLTLAVGGALCAFSFYCSMIFGSFLTYMAKHLFVNQDHFTIMENSADLPRDWTTRPFVSVRVLDVAYDPLNAPKCQDIAGGEHEDVFTAVWPGTSVACDCTEGKNVDDPRMFILGKSCPKSTSVCKSIQGWPPIRQSVMNGRRICGKRGGESFVEAVRVNALGQCPEGLQKCSDKTSMENTVCFDPSVASRDDSCPVTMMKLLKSD